MIVEPFKNRTCTTTTQRINASYLNLKADVYAPVRAIYVTFCVITGILLIGMTKMQIERLKLCNSFGDALWRMCFFLIMSSLLVYVMYIRPAQWFNLQTYGLYKNQTAWLIDYKRSICMPVAVEHVVEVTNEVRNVLLRVRTCGGSKLTIAFEDLYVTKEEAMCFLQYYKNIESETLKEFTTELTADMHEFMWNYYDGGRLPQYTPYYTSDDVESNALLARKFLQAYQNYLDTKT